MGLLRYLFSQVVLFSFYSSSPSAWDSGSCALFVFRLLVVGTDAGAVVCESKKTKIKKISMTPDNNDLKIFIRFLEISLKNVENSC